MIEFGKFNLDRGFDIMENMNLKIARELNKIAKELTDNTSDTHDF